MRISICVVLPLLCGLRYYASSITVLQAIVNCLGGNCQSVRSAPIPVNTQAGLLAKYVLPAYGWPHQHTNKLSRQFRSSSVPLQSSTFLAFWDPSADECLITNSVWIVMYWVCCRHQHIFVALSTCHARPEVRQSANRQSIEHLSATLPAVSCPPL